MMKKIFGKKNRWMKLGIVAAVVVLCLAVGTGFVRYRYDQNLKPVAASQKSVTVTIPSGYLAPQIAKLLKEKGLIRSESAFKRYVKNTQADDAIKAGTYELSPSYSVQEIVSIITQGKIKTNLITILPGKTLGQIKDAFVKSGFDAASVEAAFNPALYKNHPALVDKPADASLEGYLYPESFLKTENTTPQEVIGLSLDEMQKRLTPEWRSAIAAQGLSAYQGITLASIVEQEANTAEDRANVAQVFYNRLRAGMMLQSDVTANYAASLLGVEPSTKIDSPYNTYLHTGLPPGPISNVSESSLKAVAHPSPNDYLFFIASDIQGEEGKVYFARTQEEHQALIDKYCKTLCYTSP